MLGGGIKVRRAIKVCYAKRKLYGRSDQVLCVNWGEALCAGRFKRWKNLTWEKNQYTRLTGEGEVGLQEELLIEGNVV